jgi:Glycolipid 2-alpha-mannosyltransferase
MCSYEMASFQKVLHNFTSFARQALRPDWNKISHFNGGYCGFYNNWFIADLNFFLSQDVQFFLRWIDAQGYMYRDRLNDLVIQTCAVYSFCPKLRIHRFLDWTYEHFTLDSETNCPIWGGLTTGYDDLDAERRIQTYVEKFRRIGCTIEEFPPRLAHVPKLHTSHDYVGDLSPTYHHLPPTIPKNLTLLTLKAGRIDLPGRGDKSG